MKRILFIFLIVCLTANAQEFTKFRITQKQRAELLRKGDSYVISIEHYLDSNDKSLSSGVEKPGVSNPMEYIELAKKRADNKEYKDICLDCYVAEYNNQLERLKNYGVTDTKGFNVTVMPQFVEQDSLSILNAYKMIVAESKSKLIYYSNIKHLNSIGFRFIDEATINNEGKRYVAFVTNKYNKGNADLEIAGKDVFTFSVSEGRFLDFAGFWVKYINPNITIEKLAENKGDKYVYILNDEKRALTLTKRIGADNVWVLRNQ